MMRDIVGAMKLSQDDLLFQMHLRVWDEPLDYPKFHKSLRYLD